MSGERKYKGFSLIEILIVVGLILILAAVTIVAINPAKHFRDTRNSERSAHISEILNAVTQFTAEEGKTLTDLNIPNCVDSEGNPAAADVDSLLDDVATTGLNQLIPSYIVEIPEDPQGVNPYTICQSEGGRVLITATIETESGVGEEISVTR
jgi:prepilin-type N-terminal cleavage/methylation domain-containing protein